MMGYVGQTRGGSMFARCIAEGLGEMTQPDEFPPRRRPWILDNGAFKLWKSGQPFDGVRFQRVAEAAVALDPVFVVTPDVVADAARSLPLSLAWAPILRDIGHRIALVVQDGMVEADVAPHLDGFSFLFVGGSLDWKLSTMGYWAGVARRAGKRIHVGRMGGRKRILAAGWERIDSIDSCRPLFSHENMTTYCHAIRDANTIADGVAIMERLSQ